MRSGEESRRRTPHARLTCPMDTGQARTSKPNFLQRRKKRNEESEEERERRGKRRRRNMSVQV